MSWFKEPDVDKRIERYFKVLERCFKVKDATKKWIPYKLTPHQKLWHSQDIAILGSNAKDRIVVKSRNTSFTTSSIISNIAAVPFYPNQIVPFVRLNARRAVDLIDEAKDIVKNIIPWKNDEGVLYPFDPSKVNFDAAGSIIFPNGVEFRAFPANAMAAETIRGLRIAGSAGLIDESNYMRDFEEIYISMRDAAAGFGPDNKKHFQMNIGTTLKGKTTPFYLWLQNVRNMSHFNVHWWHVFNPKIFNPNVSIISQNLEPIVPWHNIADLENKRLEDLNKFLEEYMCEAVDDEQQFYSHSLIESCQDEELQNYKQPPNIGLFYMGIDIASVNDYFVITIFEKLGDNYIQRFLYYDNKNVDLTEMQKNCETIIDIWKPRFVRIDGNGIGFQIAQYLRKIFGPMIEPIKHRQVTTTLKETVSMNEFIHTNQKTLLTQGFIKLLPDELQLIQYSQWDYNYKADSIVKYGHGDIGIANGYALLPDNFKYIQDGSPMLTKRARDKNLESIKNSIIKEVNW